MGLLLSATVLFFTGCDSDSKSSKPKVIAPVTGDWAGQYSLAGAQPAKFTMNLQQEGDALTGSMLLDSFLVPVTGSLTDQAIELTAVYGTDRFVVFKGTVNNKSSFMSCSMTSFLLSADGVTGSWKANRK
jgi:hypothetical protein